MGKVIEDEVRDNGPNCRSWSPSYGLQCFPTVNFIIMANTLCSLKTQHTEFEEGGGISVSWIIKRNPFSI